MMAQVPEEPPLVLNQIPDQFMLGYESRQSWAGTLKGIIVDFRKVIC